ncbi:MAG: ATP cone domain-containing protein [Bacteroidales bacterium]|nr:ATP cone domain-containing protein [Bacteroidales bacterium]
MAQREIRNITIRKASGVTEKFDVEKLKRSLKNAGAQDHIIDDIINDIETWIYEGVTTKKIYTRAFTHLRRKNSPSALRYKFKQALFELGPTGFPFEQFIGEIFRKQGFEILVGQIIEGNCVHHEIDVIATNKSEQRLIECKFGKDQGKLVSVQVPLYVRSRMDDIIRKRKYIKEYSNLAFSACIVTNTRFSSDSIQYSQCAGLQLLGWDYPVGNGLKDMIERDKIFPVTVLNNLTTREKQFLLEKGIVVCSQLLNNIEILKSLIPDHKKFVMLVNELEDLNL